MNYASRLKLIGKATTQPDLKLIPHKWFISLNHAFRRALCSHSAMKMAAVKIQVVTEEQEEEASPFENGNVTQNKLSTETEKIRRILVKLLQIHLDFCCLTGLVS